MLEHCLCRAHGGHDGKQILTGGPGRNDQVHTGLTSELAQNLINHTHKHINQFILVTLHIHGMIGVVGSLNI